MLRFLALTLAVGCGGQTPHSQIDDFQAGPIFGQTDANLRQWQFSLTFDDGPGARTLELAEFLHDWQIPATFFVNGKNVPAGGKILEQLRDLGHLVANHTQNHADLQLSVAHAVEEVAATDRVIAPFVDQGHFLFRAPFGAFSAQLAQVLNSATDAQGNPYLRKYVGSVFWDVGGALAQGYSADWACWGAGPVPKLSIETCGEGYLLEMRARGKGIILFHDSHRHTVDMIRWMIPKLLGGDRAMRHPLFKDIDVDLIRADEVPVIQQLLDTAGTQVSVPNQPPLLPPLNLPFGAEMALVGNWQCSQSAWQNGQLWTCNADKTAMYRCFDGIPYYVPCACESQPFGTNDLCRAV